MTNNNNTKTKKFMLPLIALALVLGLVLTACGGTSDSTGSGKTTTSSDHNDQDVAFATEMIPHHAQAVEMSQIAAANAQSPEVKALAAGISAAQGPEIEQMSSWLEAWGEKVPETGDGMGDMRGMDHSGSGTMSGTEDMPGMMNTEEMAELEAASGATFDEMFLTMMIKHHRGAIEMARTQQAEGEYPAAIEMAKAIEKAQTREIQTMETLLASQ